MGADVGLLVASEAVAKVGTFALTVVAARALSRDDFGAYSFALAVALLLSAVPSWGFYTLLVQRGSAEPGRLRRLASETVALQTGIGVPLFLLAGVAFAVLLPGRAALAAGLILLATLLDVLLDGWRGALAVLGRQREVALALTVQRLVTAGVAITYLSRTGDLLGLCLAYGVGALGAAVALHVAVRRAGLALPVVSEITANGVRETATRSLNIGLETVAGMVLFRADMVLLGVLLGPAAVSSYAVAYRLVDGVLVLTYVLGRVVFPQMSAARDPDRVLALLRHGIGACAGVYLPFAVVVLARPQDLLRSVFGAQYVRADTVDSLRLLSLAPLLFAVAFLAGLALLAFERSRTCLWITLAAAVVNVGLNLVLIPTVGIRGAAAATTAGYLVQVALALWAVRTLGTLGSLGRSLLPSALACVLLGLVLLGLPGPFLAVLVAGGAVFALAWLAGLRRVDPAQLELLPLGRFAP